MFALGFVSVFDQIIEGIPGTAAADIFQAYMAALQEDPEKYRRCSAAGICYLPSSTVVGAALYNACSLLIHIVCCNVLLSSLSSCQDQHLFMCLVLLLAHIEISS